MFLFADTKFKQELNTQNINAEQLKNMLFQVEGKEGLFCPTKKQPDSPLTKGELGQRLCTVWHRSVSVVLMERCPILAGHRQKDRHTHTDGRVDRPQGAKV